MKRAEANNEDSQSQSDSASQRSKQYDEFSGISIKVNKKSQVQEMICTWTNKKLSFSIVIMIAKIIIANSSFMKQVRNKSFYFKVNYEQKVNTFYNQEDTKVYRLEIVFTKKRKINFCNCLFHYMVDYI